jgi:preprotein translocase subunit SecG
MINTILMLVLLFCAVCIVVLVLIQRGKGADAGAGFGAGASGTVFGARGATTALSRATAILAAVFMITCLLLSYVVSRGARAPESVLEQLSQGADTVPAATVPAAPAAPPPAAPVEGAAPAASEVPEAPAPN